MNKMNKISIQLTFNNQLCMTLKNLALEQQLSMNYIVSSIIHKAFREDSPVAKRKYSLCPNNTKNNRFAVSFSKTVYDKLNVIAFQKNILIKRVCEHMVYNHFGHQIPKTSKSFKHKITKIQPMFEKNAFLY